jgi:FixJ family two-component response regulator
VAIHIIEDDSGVRDALAELVGGLGYTVRSYADGESFIDGEPPQAGDVVVVDLGLPGMSGESIIYWLKGLGRPPRIVAISGRSRTDIDFALRALPDLPLLRKPFEPAAIAALL